MNKYKYKYNQDNNSNNNNNKIFLNYCKACDNKWETKYPPRKCPNCRIIRPYDYKLESPILYKVGHLDNNNRVKLHFVRKLN